MSRITVLLKTNEGGMWILPQLTELVRRGHSVVVIVPPGEGRLRRGLNSVGVEVEDSPFDFSFRPSYHLGRDLLRLRRLIKATRPDVLFYHLYASALAARISSVGLGVNRVHMVAGPLYLESPLIRTVERLLCRLDDQLIAGSDYTARRYREIGMPESRISSIPYGVDATRFKAGPDRRADLFGCPPETFVAIMVAYVYAPKDSVFPGVGIKGHDVLLEAWSDFCGDHPDSLLVLVGGGFDQAGERHRRHLIDAFDVSSNANLLWLESVDDVRPLYSSADLSISPSLSENHGAALEASAMSLPSIVSDAGGLPETVTPRSGWVVRAGSRQELEVAIRSARAEFDAGRLSARGQDARRQVEQRFSHDLVIPRIADRVTAGTSRPSIVAFTEQRTWTGEGGLLGRKPLPIVSALAKLTPVRLLARIGDPEPGGVAIAPSTVPVPLPWPAEGSATAQVGRLLTFIRSVLPAVRRADVVYADQPGIVGGIGLLTGRLLGKPLVVNVVGDSSESVHPSVMPGLKGRVAYAVLPRIQTWACAHATYINYVTAKALQDRYPPKRAERVYASSTVTPLGTPRPRPFPTGTASVVTIASLEQPYKGVADLIEATQLCRSRGVEVVLTVIGDGQLRRQLEMQADAMGDGIVRFAGHLYGTELYEELGRHDVFALASWTEGLPRALIEAMADGIPAVATRVGGIPELIEPIRTAPTRDPAALADRLGNLLSDREGWQRTIRVNLDVSARIFRRRNDVLEGFVASILDLAASTATPN